jgi:hypothetical protein
MSEKVFIFDEIVVAESQSAKLRAAYLDQYAPTARARGMVLEGAWRSPPVELPDRQMTLHFLWSVANVGGWWAMRLGAARANPELDVPLDGDEEKLCWWAWVDDVAVSRKRSFLTDIAEADHV